MKRSSFEKYITPVVNYKYHQIEWNDYIGNKYDVYKTVRSSFIPYTIINNEVYWILGSFVDYPREILMDFGGSCILYDPPNKHLKHRQTQFKNYQDKFGCALLELNEESKSLLVKLVLVSLGTTKPFIYQGMDDRRKEKVYFVLVYLNYEDIKDIPEIFDKTEYVHEGELLGPLDFYKVTDILNKKYKTSRNLTDFVDYLISLNNRKL